MNNICRKHDQRSTADPKNRVFNVVIASLGPSPTPNPPGWLNKVSDCPPGSVQVVAFISLTSLISPFRARGFVSLLVYQYLLSFFLPPTGLTPPHCLTPPTAFTFPTVPVRFSLWRDKESLAR